MAESSVSKPPAGVGIGIIPFQADGFIEVFYSTLILGEITVSNPSAIVGFD